MDDMWKSSTSIAYIVSYTQWSNMVKKGAKKGEIYAWEIMF